MELLVSSLNGGGEISITQTGRSSVANIPIIKTGDWDTYAVQKIPVYLMPNQHALRLKIEKGGFNIDKMVFKKQTLTEIHSGNSTESITLFPNPSKDGFINLSKETKWSVKTLVGQELMNGNGFQINLSSYSKGIYLIEFNEKVERVIVE